MDMDSLSFEDAYAQLEATVQRLEDGALPLEEALALYERGVLLAQLCAERLSAAELRIQELSQSIEEAGEPYALEDGAADGEETSF